MGMVEIIIEHVSACDCTTLDYPRHPIKPGQKDKIQAIFNPKEEELGEKIVDITIILENTDPKTGYPWIEEIKYKAVIIE
jgi:hypothetical protein